MLRAIMEGCAFAVYDNMRIAEHGVRGQECLGSGGATQSAVWCQIKADVYDRPFVVARREDGGEGGHSLGLYALTAQAVGLCGDAAECVEQLLPNRQVFEPSPHATRSTKTCSRCTGATSRMLLARIRGPRGHPTPEDHESSRLENKGVITYNEVPTPSPSRACAPQGQGRVDLRLGHHAVHQRAPPVSADPGPRMRRVIVRSAKA